VVAFDTALNQHMEQFVSNVQEKKQAAETPFTEERVRFSKERMEQTVASMGNIHRMAVSRVRGFRNTRVDKQRMEDMLGRIKSRMPKKK
jgi:chromatin segregation and condensation protein Rec8/ScpA/Scc1 (kleisin family)